MVAIHSTKEGAGDRVFFVDSRNISPLSFDRGGDGAVKMNANTEGPIDRFPLVWLNYRKRIQRDLERVWKKEDENVFTPNYFDRVAAFAKEADERIIKLVLFQSSLLAFQILGLLGGDISLSASGLTLKNVPGLKEIVLVVYVTTALVIWLVLISRDTRLAVLEKMVELSEDKETVDLAKLAVPSQFNMRFYFPRHYMDWVFDTRASRGVAIVFGFSLLAMLACMVVTSLAVNAYIFIDIFLHPALGRWSYLSLAYAVLAMVVGAVYLIFFYCPLPFRDQSIVKHIAELEEKNDPSYRDKLQEVYGPDSKYRRVNSNPWWKFKFKP